MMRGAIEAQVKNVKVMGKRVKERERYRKRRKNCHYYY